MGFILGICSFIKPSATKKSNSVNKYLQMLGAENTAMNKADKTACPYGAYT